MRMFIINLIGIRTIFLLSFYRNLLCLLEGTCSRTGRTQTVKTDWKVEDEEEDQGRDETTI